jgi:hypothetical protein
MGEFVESMIFVYSSFDDFNTLWGRLKSTKQWKLDKQETLRMIDNFKNLYQGYDSVKNLSELTDLIEKE